MQIFKYGSKTISPKLHCSWAYSIQIKGIHTIFRPKKQIPSLQIWLHSVNKWRSHMNIYIVWTKAFYGLKYLPNIATWIWSFQKHLSFSEYDQKNLTYQSLHPRNVRYQNWSYSKPFRHLWGERAAEFGREKNPRHPRRASWSFRCKAS